MPRGRKAKKAKKRNDIQVVSLIIASILLAVLIYSNSGWIGENLSPALGGIMGWIKYIIPIGTFAIAIFLIGNRDKDTFIKKITEYSIILLCITTIMTVIQISEGHLDINQDFEDVVIQAYNRGVENRGGGAVGAIFAVALINLLGKVGTIIFVIGIALIDAIFLFGIKPTEIIRNYLEERERVSEEIKEQKVDNKQLKIENLGQIEKENPKKKEKVSTLTEDQINIKIASNNDIHEGLFKKEEEIKEDKSKEVLTLEHALTVEDENYEFPPLDLLKQGASTNKVGKKAVTETANKLQKTLYSFGVSAKVENVSVGPAITRYELRPAEGVRVNKIANLADDIALNLAAESIRIEAPIPGKQAVGIEIPNAEKEVVALRDILECKKFKEAKSKLAFALGKDAAGEPVVTDIAKMPHVLIAGSTGSRKECLYKHTNIKYYI